MYTAGGEVCCPAKRLSNLANRRTILLPGYISSYFVPKVSWFMFRDELLDFLADLPNLNPTSLCHAGEYLPRYPGYKEYLIYLCYNLWTGVTEAQEN